MGNIFKMIVNAIMRRFVGWGVKSGMDYFGGGKSRTSYPQNGQRPQAGDPAARRARHAANKARRAGR